MGTWGDDLNFGNGYAYAGSNPLGYIDPTGESSTDGYHWHHMFPAEFWDPQKAGHVSYYLDRMGLSATEAKRIFNGQSFGMLVPGFAHQGGIHATQYNWNWVWREWFRNQDCNKKITVEMIKDQMKRMQDFPYFKQYFDSPLIFQAKWGYSTWRKSKYKNAIGERIGREIKQNLLKSGVKWSKANSKLKKAVGEQSTFWKSMGKEVKTAGKWGGKTVILGSTALVILDTNDVYAEKGAKGVIVSFTPVVGTIADTIETVGPPFVGVVENWGRPLMRGHTGEALDDWIEE